MSYFAWDPKIETHCMSPESVDHFSLILAQLPMSAIMLEVGCYIGGVLCIMSDCRPDCDIHGIDDSNWSGKIGKVHHKLPEGRVIFDLQGKSTIERFHEVIGTRTNTQGYDVYMGNISWWWTKIKTNGWISGQAIRDGKQAIDDFATAHGCKITWIDHFFACQKA